MSDNSIYKRIADHVADMYEKYPQPNLVYHNLAHTQKVVARAEEISAHYQLSDSDMLVIYLAAWFHDTGHLFTEISMHEQKSVELATEFMKQEGLDEATIEKVAACIHATAFPNKPVGLLQEIMCDADTYHFGTDDFRKTNRQIKKELELRNYTTPLLEWKKNTLGMLEDHVYYTSYCKVLLEEGKQKNMERLRKKYLKESTSNVRNDIFDQNDRKSKQQTSLINRGIQTTMRLASQNHLELSELADRKANILISVNAIMISIILSVLIRKLDAEPIFTVPAILFLFFTLATIIVAILATRPVITEGRFTREDVLNKKTNLLFFGNFYKSTLDDYEWAMATMMTDRNYLYGMLIKDIHQLGVVLARKYTLVRWAYNIFMVGLIASVIAFTIAAMMNTQHPATINNATGTPL
ncbi:MAG TPA: Pycsar system effector family protein [Flavipsychrobacter sp.]|nr:Pycsar system effector family protein [Flavipsychrobacter sp.]